MSSRGGQGNEIGSVYRASVAAWLAVHGISGQLVGFLGTLGVTVTGIALETEDRVDDIRCELSDGKVLLIQAKSECGADASLRDALHQWIRQYAEVPAGGSPDEQRPLLGLAAASFKGKVSALPAALDRFRVDDPGVPSAAERVAFDTVGDLLADGITNDDQVSLLRTAYALQVDAVAPSSAHRGSAEAWLHAAGVDVGLVAGSFSALRDYFHVGSSRAAATHMGDWLDVLASVGARVRGDPDGPAGQREQAVRDALADHRAGLAARTNWITFGPLAADVPPMYVPDLADSFHVSIPVELGDERERSVELPLLARSAGRLLVTGLPGAGKSTAVAQLAATWAGQPDAPVPVVVRLEELARHVRVPHDVTVPMLVDVAIAASRAGDHPALRPALSEAIESGRAVLVLDGLDECRAKAADVADGLAYLLREAHPDTGVIVTTRRSAQAAASKLGLPLVTLDEPSHLAHTLCLLIDHVAESRGIIPAGPERIAWSTARREWIYDASARDPGLWKVPLLATSMTLLSTIFEVRDLPRTRAKLLVEAVRGSVATWESGRSALGLEANLLLDGFAAEGHHLARSADPPSRGSIEVAVAELIGPGWGLPPRAAADTAAKVVEFWDDTVGAFLVTEDGTVVPRERHLVEIADAMWAVSRPPAERSAWVQAALRSNIAQESVVLAAALAPDVHDALLDSAAPVTPIQKRLRALRWANAAAMETAADPATDQRVLARLVQGLAEAAAEPFEFDEEPEGGASDIAGLRRVLVTGPRQRQRERDGRGWEWARRLAALPLTEALRSSRDELLAALDLTDEQRVIADALRLLGDAGFDQVVVLPSTTVEAARRLLDLDVAPATTTKRQISRRRVAFDHHPDWRPLVTGHAEAAARLAPYLGSLGDQPPLGASAEVVAKLKNIGLSSAAGDRLNTALARLGHPQDFSTLDIVATLAKEFGVDGTTWRWAYDAIRAVVPEPPPTNARDRWHLTELTVLADTIGLGSTGIHDGRLAATVPIELRTGLFAALADALVLDRRRLAAQAAHVLDARFAGNETPHRLVEQPSLRHAWTSAAMTGAQHTRALLLCLNAQSDLVALAANVLLERSDDPDVPEAVATAAPGLRPDRRKAATTLAIHLSADPEGETKNLLAGTDPPARAAAAAAVHELPESETTLRVLGSARNDDDLTIRIAAGADAEAAAGATRWSCEECASFNALDLEDCQGCANGTKPGLSHTGRG